MWPALRLLFRWVAACSVIANRLPKRLGKQTTNCYLAHPRFSFFFLFLFFFFWQLTSLGFLSRFGSSSAWVEADPTANLAGKTRSQFLCKPKQKHVGRLLLICLADRRLLISDLRSPISVPRSHYVHGLLANRKRQSFQSFRAHCFTLGCNGPAPDL